MKNEKKKKETEQAMRLAAHLYCVNLLNMLLEIGVITEVLEKRRGSSYAQRNRYPFSGILYCPDCGKTFRRQTTNGKAYWLCAARAAGKTKCRSIRFPEERLEDTFTLLLHKLRDNRESLVESLIQKTEEFYHTRHANTEVIQRIDKEVADLTAKNHLLVKLY